MLEQFKSCVQKKKNFDIYFVSYVKINLKWIIDMQVKPKTIIRLGNSRKFLLSW